MLNIFINCNFLVHRILQYSISSEYLRKDKINFEKQS